MRWNVYWEMSVHNSTLFCITSSLHINCQDQKASNGVISQMCTELHAHFKAWILKSKCQLWWCTFQIHLYTWFTSAACRMLILGCSGSSAIIHIEILQQLMMHSGRKAFEMFEWIAATGLSALFVLLMVYGEDIHIIHALTIIVCGEKRNSHSDWACLAGYTSGGYSGLSLYVYTSANAYMS